MCLAAVADVFNSESVICRFEGTSAPSMQQRVHSIDPSNPHTMPASITCASLHCHPLEKKSKVYSGRYQCDVCKGDGRGWVFHCPECSWDAHPRCVAEKLNSSCGGGGGGGDDDDGDDDDDDDHDDDIHF